MILKYKINNNFLPNSILDKYSENCTSITIDEFLDFYDKCNKRAAHTDISKNLNTLSNVSNYDGYVLILDYYKQLSDSDKTIKDLINSSLVISLTLLETFADHHIYDDSITYEYSSITYEYSISFHLPIEIQNIISVNSKKPIIVNYNQIISSSIDFKEKYGKYGFTKEEIS